MRLAALKHAVHKFQTLADDVNPIADACQGPRFSCLVRQRGDRSTESGYVCQAIGLEEPSESLWVKFREDRNGAEHTIVAYLDIDSIDAIEFECFDAQAKHTLPSDPV